MQNNEFTPLGALLPRAINHYNLGRQVKGSLMCHHFRKLAVQLWDDSIDECLRPKSYHDGVLSVSVVDSGWAQQIQFKKNALMEGLKATCPEIPLKSLRITVEAFSS